MKGPMTNPHIDTVWMVITTTSEGMEGVSTMLVPEFGAIPMVATSPVTAELLERKAEMMHEETGMMYTLVVVGGGRTRREVLRNWPGKFADYSE